LGGVVKNYALKVLELNLGSALDYLRQIEFLRPYINKYFPNDDENDDK
jgi:hypothetical protein